MSLKEIKGRIASVSNTRKTTSAMKMVSSVKLRKAQSAVQSTLPYVEQLDGILGRLSVMDESRRVSMLCERAVHRVAIVAISSDSSLCGGFNSNIIRHSRSLYDRCASECEEAPMLFVVGQKITDYYRKSGIEADASFSGLISKRNFSVSAALADKLTELFESQTIDRVIITYTHFKSAGSQTVTDYQLLPVRLPEGLQGNVSTDYILEPSAEELLKTLLPQVIRMRMHTAILDSFCSEQAARVVAMQAATDNADNLIAELTLQYNKLRQQAITNELLDLAGGQIEN